MGIIIKWGKCQYFRIKIIKILVIQEWEITIMIIIIIIVVNTIITINSIICYKTIIIIIINNNIIITLIIINLTTNNISLILTHHNNHHNNQIIKTIINIIKIIDIIEDNILIFTLINRVSFYFIFYFLPQFFLSHIFIHHTYWKYFLLFKINLDHNN